MAIKGVLLGFSDFFDEVGAAKRPTPKTPGAKPPTGKPVGTAPSPTARSYGAVKQTKTMKHHGRVLGKAKQTLLKAARGLGRAQVSLAQRPSAAHAAAASAAMRVAATKATAAQQAAVQAASAPSPAAMRTAAASRGAAARSILGAAAAIVQAKNPVSSVVTANLSPKAKAAVEKHNKAVAEAKKAAQALAKHTLKTRQSVKDLAKAAVNQKKVAKNLRTKAGRTHVGALMNHPIIGHEVAEALGEYYEAVGAAPDPSNPGFLDDGSPDPAFATTTSITTPADASQPVLTDDTTTAALSEEDDTLDIINASKDLGPVDPMQGTVADYKSVGGVLYDESKGRPNGFIGSAGLMMRTTDQKNSWGVDTTETEGTDHFGYVWGQYEADGPEKGVRWGSELTPNAWNYIHGARTVLDKHGWADKVTDAEAFASESQGGPNKNGIAPSGQRFGPLVGNPAYPDFHGVRVDAQGNIFWYPQEAPDWLTLPLKQAAMITETKEKKAADDEAKQFALEQQKQQRDAQAAQAAQDAANALAESQAASQAKVTASQEEGAQAQAETAAEQALVQAQQQETEQAATEAQSEQQAQQILIQRAQRQEQLMQENPDIELALMAQQALEAGDEGGDEGEGDEETLTDEDAADFSEESEPGDIDYSED
jgi:hypothetical protein